MQVIGEGSVLRGFRGWRAIAGPGAGLPAGAGGGSLPAQPLGGLADFGRWVRQTAAGRPLALLILTHGTAPLASTDAPLGRLLVVREADAGAETAACLAQLRRGLGAGPAAEALFLETCYAATLDNLWDAAGLARILVGAPTELPSPGIEWGRLLEDLGSGGWDRYLGTPEAAAQACRDLAALRAGGVCALPTERVPGLREAMVQLVREACAEPAAATRSALWARGQRHGAAPRGPTVNLRDLATALEANAAGDDLRAAAATLYGLLDPSGAGVLPGGLGSASVAFPVPVEGSTLARYSARCRFALETSFGSLLGSVSDYRQGAAPALPWTWSR